MKLLTLACHLLWITKEYNHYNLYLETPNIKETKKYNIIGNWLIKEIQKENTFKKVLVLLFSIYYRNPVNIAAYTDYMEEEGKVFVYIKKEQSDLFSVDEKVLCLELIKLVSREYIVPEYPKTINVNKT